MTSPHDAYFETRFPFDPRRDVVWREVCRYLQKKYIPAEACILDLGAGYCNFINHIHGRGKHALDISTRVSEWADPDVTTHVGSCTEMDYLPGDHFDIVFASNLFEHLSREELDSTLQEIRRILQVGGRLIALQPNFKYCFRTYFDDYTHVQIFTDEGLSNLLQAHGYAILDVHPQFLPVNMKSTLRVPLPRLDLITRLYLNLPFKPLGAQMLLVVENQIEHPEQQVGFDS